MVREDLIDGAITFLQDASVSSAPIEQKISFLRSKNLTQEEIDVSLARVGQPSAAQSPPQQRNYASQYRQGPQQYGGYQQQPYWGQPPPEAPRRDWRDWFIMATVAGGVGAGMYWTAKRYIYPLIAPPTPPQLEQDKASIDASFEKTFALLDQLATDTQELKDAESSRKERLDRALSEVESVIGKMKEANENRELEAKRMAKEIDEIRQQVPQAIKAEKENTDNKLKDLTTEMKSLKTLVQNRMGQGQAAPRPSPSVSSQALNGVNGSTSSDSASSTVASSDSGSQTNGSSQTNGTNGVHSNEEKLAKPTERSASSGPFAGRTLGGSRSPQIPAWQLAAKKKAEDAKKAEEAAADSAPAQDVTESGTAEEERVGA